MKNLRSLALIVFADISFQICNVLIAGYLFVSLKGQENVQAEINSFMEKGIEFPLLDSSPSDKNLSGTSDSHEIAVPKEGGRYVINGKEVPKADLDNNIRGLESRAVVVCIDTCSPSGDTLYLLDILNKHKITIKVIYLPEG